MKEIECYVKWFTFLRVSLEVIHNKYGTLRLDV